MSKEFCHWYSTFITHYLDYGLCHIFKKVHVLGTGAIPMPEFLFQYEMTGKSKTLVILSVILYLLEDMMTSLPFTFFNVQENT